MYFQDRMHAGHILAKNLEIFRDRPGVLVLGLPRGGVPVAAAVASELNAPLDVFVVRKLGVPGREELAMGAIASGGVRVMHDGILREMEISEATIEAIAAREQKELVRREVLYRGERPPPVIRDRTIIIVDDGLATGSTMKAAVTALRQHRPARLIVAVPVAPPQTCVDLRTIADEVVCPVTPEPFYAVGGFYVDFGQISDDAVRGLLQQATLKHA